MVPSHVATSGRSLPTIALLSSTLLTDLQSDQRRPGSERNERADETGAPRRDSGSAGPRDAEED
jgi:hypothetical protein